MKILKSIKRPFGNKSEAPSVSLEQKGEHHSLYKVGDVGRIWLRNDNNSYVDNCLKKYGIYEPALTKIVRKYVSEGDVVLDVGANTGYYSLIFSHLVGGTGHVVSFEPTQNFRTLLLRNLDANDVKNVSVQSYGLSDKNNIVEIGIGDYSATIHASQKEEVNVGCETIEVKRLDDVFDHLNLDRINFVKIDVDGHEFFSMEGAKSILTRYKPKMVIEVSHLHYLEAGVMVWDFYDYLKNLGCFIYNEHTGKEIFSKREFLVNCCNFHMSSNILVSFERL